MNREKGKSKTSSKRAQQQAAAAAAEEEAQYAAPASRAEKWKKGGKNKHYEDESEEFFRQFGVVDGLGGSSVQRETASESLFTSWEDLLRGHEELKCRLDAIATVHGWESKTFRRSFLSGVEPRALVQSLRTDVAALEPDRKSVV